MSDVRMHLCGAGIFVCGVRAHLCGTEIFVCGVRRHLSRRGDIRMRREDAPLRRGEAYFRRKIVLSRCGDMLARREFIHVRRGGINARRGDTLPRRGDINEATCLRSSQAGCLNISSGLKYRARESCTRARKSCGGAGESRYRASGFPIAGPGRGELFTSCWCFRRPWASRSRGAPP